MIDIKHTPTKSHSKFYTVEADSIQEVIDELIPRIRPQSQEFYKHELPVKLKKDNTAIIDRHAGNGWFYFITLNTK